MSDVLLPLKMDDTGSGKNLVPVVLVSAEDVVTTRLSVDQSTMEENGVQSIDDDGTSTSPNHADDSPNASSLLLDSTLTSNGDISLLDDPFIAIGAGCSEKDSLLEEPTDDLSTESRKGFEASSPDSFSEEKTETSEMASASVDELPGGLDTAASTVSCDENDDGDTINVV